MVEAIGRGPVAEVDALLGEVGYGVASDAASGVEEDGAAPLADGEAVLPGDLKHAHAAPGAEGRVRVVRVDVGGLEGVALDVEDPLQGRQVGVAQEDLSLEQSGAEEEVAGVGVSRGALGLEVTEPPGLVGQPHAPRAEPPQQLAGHVQGALRGVVGEKLDRVGGPLPIDGGGSRDAEGPRRQVDPRLWRLATHAAHPDLEASLAIGLGREADRGGPGVHGAP